MHIASTAHPRVVGGGGGDGLIQQGKTTTKGHKKEVNVNYGPSERFVIKKQSRQIGK
jgi:accessory colonization factor AcfC